MRGWLQHMWRKATTDDDWSEGGAGPHEWWDKTTGPPMTSFPRFDLHEASYPLLVLSEKTPAWREVYATILDRLTARYTTHWGAVDWLNQFGNDPDRQSYPKAWKGTIVPEKLFGEYNTPGWTGNGLGDAGVESDPIEADAMLFFKGFLCLLMSIANAVGGKGTWEVPWLMAGVHGSTKEWTLTKLASHLSAQFGARAHGLH